jgi:hypothetical protein
MAFLFLSAARSQIDAALHRRAQNVVSAFEHHVPVSPDPEAARLRDSGYRFNLVGLMFMLSCLVCGIVAFIRRESGWYSIPILLLFFDVTMLFLS